MAKKAETRLKELVVKKIKGWKRPIWLEKIQQVTVRGTPDLIGCTPCDLCGRGLFVALELKDGDLNDLGELQRLKLLQIENAGGCGLVVRKTSDLVVLEERLKLSDRQLRLILDIIKDKI